MQATVSQAPPRAEDVPELLDWIAQTLEHDTFRAAALAITTELSTRLGCERVCLGFEQQGRTRVEALSHSATFDPRTTLIRDLADAMDEARDQDATVVHPPPAEQPPRVTQAHANLAGSHGADAVCTVPIVSRGRASGAITFERHGEPFDWAEIQHCARIVSLVGPVLALQRATDARVLERLRSWCHGQSERLLGPGHPQAKLAAVLSIVFLLASAALPGTYRVKADATLEGVVQRAVVAGIDGYIAESVARAGDRVKSGHVLGRLDERDLTLERRKWVAREQQMRREYREALAQHDRTQRAILQARLDEARAQLDLLDEQLARTLLVAPFDGIVVRGDLSQSLGSPVTKGDVLYEIAPEDGYRIILAVDERDVARVEPGRAGQLTLSAMPGETLPLHVDKVTPVSAAEDGHNVFRVEARLDHPMPGLRPGFEGVARVEVGRRRLLWIWTHEFVDWLRLATWSWWP